MKADTGEKVRVLDASNNRSNALQESQNAGVKPNNNGESVKGEGCENIPPYRRLKVLLVEDDDSTRHVVAALLRNCGYQVVSAANGLQAWTLLLDESRDFNLVLTDVVMPGLSGVGLLARIVHRESLKKIPVVMMSSQDSTDVVFKCLSKGAADFLVKPVRKNELKNLWQHSWRRCQSSSGSGCESETGRFACGGSENGEPASEDVRISDQSDNGSATQSSCTKRILVELGSPRKGRQPNFHKGKRSSRRNKDSQTVEEINDRSNADLEGEATTCEQNMVSDQPAVPPVELVDLIGHITSEQTERRRAHEEVESEMGGSNNPEVLKDSSSDPTSTSKLELSLRSSSAVDNRTSSILRPSGGASAFSRYNTPKQTQPPPPQQEHLELTQHQEERRKVLTVDVNRNSDGGMSSLPGEQKVLICPQQRAVVAPVNFPVQYATLVSYDHQTVPLAGHAAYYYSQPALPPWQHAFSPQRKESEMVLEQQQRNFQAFTNILAHHHHYHIEHHHQHSSAAEPGMSNRFVSTSRDVSPTYMETPGCGSTTAAEGGGKQFNTGFSGSSHGNGSVSGSNNGSNGFNHSNININTMTNSNNNNGGIGNGCGDSGSGNLNSPNGVTLVSPGGSEQNRVRREAALNKFRLKRKERCFEKKVRYQSRKRLAEQRPRVRGQFVSQAVYDSSVNNAMET